MRAFLPPDFVKRAAKEMVAEDDLFDSVLRADAGLVDADLGSGLIKQRIARRGQGRSGGFRTVIAYRYRELAVFLHMFRKNEKANLTKSELDFYRALSSSLMKLAENDLLRLAADRRWKRIDHGEGSQDLPQ